MCTLTSRMNSCVYSPVYQCVCALALARPSKISQSPGSGFSSASGLLLSLAHSHLLYIFHHDSDPVSAVINKQLIVA